MRLHIDRVTAAAWAVLAIAVAVRLRNLATWDMWADEVQTLWMSETGTFAFGPTYRTAPLNFLLTGFAIWLFGSSQLSLRIVPFLCGVLTVALMYRLFQRWIGRRAALLAMLTLGLSMWHVYWSQTARHFALQTLFVLLAVHAFLTYWRSERRTALLAACACLALSLFVHSSSGFVVAALLAFVLGSWVLNRRAEATAPRLSTRKHAWAATALLGLIIAYLPIYFTVGRYLRDYTVAWNPPWNVAGSLAFYVPPWLALAAAAGATLLAYEGERDLAALMATLLVVPMALVTLASAFTIASAAYALSTVVPLAALVGVAGDRALAAGNTMARRWTARIAVAAIVLSQANDLLHYHTFYHGLKPRWQAALAYVARHREASELVLASEGDVAQYYLGRSNVEWFDRHASETNGANATASSTHGVWYVVYVSETDPLAIPAAHLESVRMHSTLRALFPLHYGAKDRTIGVFYQSPRTAEP